MKKIVFNHDADTISASFGLNEEQVNDCMARTENTVKELQTTSRVTERLMDVYDEEPAKLAYCLIILGEVIESNKAELASVSEVESD